MVFVSLFNEKLKCCFFNIKDLEVVFDFICNFVIELFDFRCKVFKKEDRFLWILLYLKLKILIIG